MPGIAPPAVSPYAVWRRYHPQQIIKWTVYSLLLLNWGYYLWDDWSNAQHTLRHGGTLLEWARAFATSLDEAAWFVLLFLWELETYVLDTANHTPFRQRMFLAIRLCCYAFILHTVAARTIDFVNLQQVQPLPQVSTLCALAGTDFSFTHNLDYTLIDAGNCATLSDASRFWAVDNSAVTDAAGLAVERVSAWIDLQDALTWLLVMFTIELAIWLQERDITGGALMWLSHAGKVLYAVLFLHAAYWAWRGHWVYAWDQVLWICGFFAIELNVRDWRQTIEEESMREETPPATGAAT